jgi:hypothetical protein
MPATILGEQGVQVPTGTTAQRPTPTNGMVRYNTSTKRLEVYADSSWESHDESIDGWASLDFTKTSGTMNSYFAQTGTSAGDRIVMQFNVVNDPYNILATAGSNQFTVSKTGVHLMQGQWAGHNNAHYWGLYIFNNTDNRFAPLPNSTFTGGDGFSSVPYGFSAVADPLHTAAPNYYWLETGKTYTIRNSVEGTGGLGSGTNYLAAGYTINGVPMHHSMHRTTLYRLRGY